jgi:hypothetical protein
MLHVLCCGHQTPLTLALCCAPLLVCRYSAALRLDPSLAPAAVSAHVDDVMSRLGLTHVARSTVLSGTGVSGVSGGERRRVAIGMELVIDPQVRLYVLVSLLVVCVM